MAVQRQENGNLSWLQDGHVVTVSKEDSAQYSPALETEDMQNSAQHQNTANRNAYSNELAIAQENVDASKPIPGVPVKPEYITVTDPVMSGTTVTKGKSSTGPWPTPPGLPDLQHKMVFKSGASTATEEPFIIEKPAVEHHEEAASPSKSKK